MLVVLQGLGLLAPGVRLCSVAEVPNPKLLGLDGLGKGRISSLNPWDDDPQRLILHGIGFRAVLQETQFWTIDMGFPINWERCSGGGNVLETPAAFRLKLPRQEDDMRSDHICVCRSGVGGLPLTHWTFSRMSRDVFQAVCATFIQIQPRTFPNRVGEWIDKA